MRIAHGGRAKKDSWKRIRARAEGRERRRLLDKDRPRAAREKRFLKANSWRARGRALGREGTRTEEEPRRPPDEKRLRGGVRKKNPENEFWECPR
eukprot:12404614-Karenia_brevis.AAC.1